MIDVAAYVEAPWQRLARWTGSTGLIALMHGAAAVLAFLFWQAAEPPDTPPGAIMVDLAALAAESPSDQQELSDQPQVQQAAPPPSPVDADEQESAAAEPPSPQPAAPAEPLREAAPEPSPVPEAPLAPEPEVTLPKAEPVNETPVKEIAERPVEPPTEKAAEKPASKAPVKRETSKSAKKSDSAQQQKAAASAKGRFDPNPVYRAKPAYPAGARAQKIEGYVVVAYAVSPSGAVTSARVVSASPPGIFNGASIAAVRQWRFRPSPQGGSRSTTIRFKLR